MEIITMFSDSEGCLIDPATNGGKRYYESDSGTLQYPKPGVNRYGNNKKCIWSIKTNKYASGIKIKFDDVDIEFDKFCGGSLSTATQWTKKLKKLNDF